MEEQTDDKTVIREVLAGNREAFALLVDKYKAGLYRLLLGLDEQLSRQMQDMPGRLPDFFTEQVMERIRLTEMDAARGVRLGELSGMRKARRVKSLRWGSTAAIGAVAVSLLFTLPDGLPLKTEPQTTKSYSSPLPSLMFIGSEPKIDIGLREAQALGVVQQANVQVKDKGYTLILQDVVADPTRMVLSIRITDNTGQSAKQAMDRFDFQQLHIKDSNGRDIGQLKSSMPMSNSNDDGSEQFTQKYMMLTYIFPDGQPEGTVLIQSDVNELKTGKNGKGMLKGNWSFTYEADMAKANALSVISDLDESYLTDEGLQVKMNQLVRTPAGVQLKFTTSLSEAAAARTPAEMKKQLEVMYHLENENGYEITRMNSSKEGGYRDTSIAYTMKEDKNSNKLHWTYYFTFLPYDSMKIRFILDGYYIPITSHDSIVIRPETLKEQPTIFNHQGDLLNIHDMKITEIPDEPGISGWMTVSGSFINKFRADQWVAYDPVGNEYKVVFRGAYRDDEKVIIDGPDGGNSPSYFIAKGLTKLPQELTLVRTITDKRYTDVNWSFELPAIKRNDALQSIAIPMLDEE
jgi:hypothetical protein